MNTLQTTTIKWRKCFLFFVPFSVHFEKVAVQTVFLFLFCLIIINGGYAVAGRGPGAFSEVLQSHPN